MKTEVVVIGAGAIGLTLAYELARRGRAVVVVERDRIVATETNGCSVNTPFRSASSWAAAGILPPANLAASTDPIERLRGLSHALYPELAARLQAESGIDPQLKRCGGWYLSDTPGETAAMIGMVAFWRDLSIECREMELDDLVRQEPAMRHWAGSATDAHAWWVPDEYQIRTPLFLQALIVACRRLGVEFWDQTRVCGISESSSAVTIACQPIGKSSVADRTSESVNTPKQLTADQTVVCAGAWSGLVAARLRLSHGLVPVRGQMLLFKSERPLLSSIINLGQRYFVPRCDGAVLVGSCEEEVGFQHGTTPDRLTEFRELVRTVCPPLAATRELAAWSGLRPLTFDGFPMCGKLPGSQSVYVAAGHFRSGVHLAPGTARCMADLMTGLDPPIDLAAFGVGKQQDCSPSDQF